MVPSNSHPLTPVTSSETSIPTNIRRSYKKRDDEYKAKLKRWAEEDANISTEKHFKVEEPNAENPMQILKNSGSLDAMLCSASQASRVPVSEQGSIKSAHQDASETSSLLQNETAETTPQSSGQSSKHSSVPSSIHEDRSETASQRPRPRKQKIISMLEV